MEKDYSSSERIREENEAELRWERTRRHHRIFTAVLILLVMALVGAAWYAYPILQRHEARLSQTELQIPAVQKYVTSLDGQAKATGSQDRRLEQPPGRPARPVEQSSR